MISERNRFDLDWQNAQFTWRYRNKLTIERTLTIVVYHPQPYVAVEPFYGSRYDVVVRIELHVLGNRKQATGIESCHEVKAENESEWFSCWLGLLPVLFWLIYPLKI